MDLARGGTSGLFPGNSHTVNPVPSSSTKMEIPTPEQGKVFKELFKSSSRAVQNQESLITAFPFPTSSFSQRTYDFPLELALQVTSYIQRKFPWVSWKIPSFWNLLSWQSHFTVTTWSVYQMRHHVTQNLTSLSSSCTWCQFFFISTDFVFITPIVKKVITRL